MTSCQIIANTTGVSNVAIGSWITLGNNTTGSWNTAIGDNSLLTNTTGINNVAIGTTALQSNVTKIESTAIGYAAMKNADSAAGGAVTYNTAVGAYALQGSGTPSNNTGTQNTAIGHSALIANTSGSSNTAVGANALQYDSTGTDNTAVGMQAMMGTANTPLTGNFNTAVGPQALFAMRGAAQRNTALGYSAGAVITTGSDNTLLGYAAGDFVSGSSNIIVGEVGNITTGASNILIGNSLSYTTAASSSQLDIGDVITGTTGGTGKIGIGLGSATAPGTTLDVNGGVTMEPVTVTLTANNTVLATANRSYFRVTSDNTTETNRIFCFGAGTLGQVLIIEWTSSTNRGEIVKNGNCSGAGGAVTASIAGLVWAPHAAETILQLMYNGTHWIQIAGSANY